MDFAERLVKLREAKGLSQYEVADRLGIKRPRYNAWEQGIAKPRADMIKKLADFFEVTPSYLLGYDETSVPEWATKKDVRDFRKLLEEETLMFDGIPLDDEDKEKILRVVEAIFWDAKKRNKRKPVEEKFTENNPSVHKYGQDTGELNGQTDPAVNPKVQDQ